MNIESLEQGGQSFVEEKRANYESKRRCIDIALFSSAVLEFFSVSDKKVRKELIGKIWASCDWYRHHVDKKTGKGVYSETSASIAYKHELHTAICLTRAGFDVLFAPPGMFDTHARKFDVFLIWDAVMLKADLKFITSTNPDTIAGRIKYGSTQASRVVLQIACNIRPKVLIDALRSGCFKNETIVDILLIYKNCCYILPKNLILSKRISTVLK